MNYKIVFNKFPLSLVLYFLICFPNVAYFSAESEESIKYAHVINWANKIGNELWNLGGIMSRKNEVLNSFKKAQIVPRNGQKILHEMASDLTDMVKAKIGAVERIMESTEATAMSHKDTEVDPLFPYYNAKEMVEYKENDTIFPTFRPYDFFENPPVTEYVPPKAIVLKEHPHFFNMSVNTSLSSVHVPENVFDREPEVIKAIQWSENLDIIFQDNYRKDPTLSFQFFASATGFMRQFPATRWNQEVVDLYDCRLRTWYINAANSPKDIIILIDNSGSMTGLKKDIARHVVNTILDTLGTNDYVNIFTFNVMLEDIVPCFNDSLVQANMENIRELKLGLEFNTTEIANFTAALSKAFDIMERYRNERGGSQCNQAIMLISDGVPFYYKEIFEQYNWMNNSQIPVRIFTYLIGREGAEVKQIKWIACENRGYYVHLSTLAEVREQVLNYIAVMARPLVLHRTDHPMVWSDVYADVVDPKMTDYLWNVKERQEQRERFIAERNNKKLFYSDEEQNRRTELKLKESLEQSTNSDKYIFMTTVSMPVFDRSENATRIANLLGVAGTDIPLNDIKKIMSHFALGVSGYAFIVTNNGHLLLHPDLRPVFQDILKPSYNSVDMLEVELMDDDSQPRAFNQKLTDMRDMIVQQASGNTLIQIKHHIDNMKRISRVNRKYYWTEIPKTPFTLVITYPQDLGAYQIEVKAEDEIHRMHVQKVNLYKSFNGSGWKIHPDWLYCKHSLRHFNTSEMELLYFLERMERPGWKWPESRTPLAPEHPIICDRNLMQAVVMDAHSTEWFSRNVSFFSKDSQPNEFRQRFGVTVVFMATHSGLTRWHKFSLAEESRPENEFNEKNSRSIDEIWYKRAVEHYAEDPYSFVFSVPFDIGNRNDTLVTASHAIFARADNNKSAPAAVVGFQFLHSAFYSYFKGMTSNCNVDGAVDKCKNNCNSEDIDCYVIDNNGYIIVGDINDTGKFFGEVRGGYMRRLVEDGIYKEVKIYDYQAVCFVRTESSNPASILKTPFLYILELLKQLGRFIILFWIQCTNAFEAYSSYANEELGGEYYEIEPTENYTPATRARERDFDKRVLINKTRPTACDQMITLYQLNVESKSLFERPAQECERPFVVVQIPHTNLILMVIDKECQPENEMKLTTLPTEINYYPSLACYKASANISRRRPSSCISQHSNESHITLCGKGCMHNINYSTIVFAITFWKISHLLFG